MSWQTNYAIENIRKSHDSVSVGHLRGDAITLTMPDGSSAIAVISADHVITAEAARRYHADYPEMDFLCGYRKACAWEGGAIEYLESNNVGWGSAGTLGSAIPDQINTASHKTYFFAYRLINQLRSVTILRRDFDRVFTMRLANGRTVRVGMIHEYEPTADTIRTFWNRFGPIEIAWNINPNGSPTSNAIEAGHSLGCEVVKWEELREIIRTS